MDSFTTEIYTLTGLTRYMVLVSINYVTRKVNVAGIIQQAHGDWMLQKASGIKPIRTLPMSPHLISCVVERFIRSIKSECPDRMLIFGERHPEYVIKEYMEHYHTERALELLPEGRLMERMRIFTLLADPGRGFRGCRRWGGSA